jgi:hypothetical protein
VCSALGTHAIILFFLILSLCSEMLVFDSAGRDLHSPDPKNGTREINVPIGQSLDSPTSLTLNWLTCSSCRSME